MATPNKLPRSYFRKPRPIGSIPRFTQKAPKEGELTFGQRVVRRTYWTTLGLPLVEDMRRVSKLTHLGKTLTTWRMFKSKGHLDEEVAVIVDGSVRRRIRDVKLFGEIVIQEPATMEAMYKAVYAAYTAVLMRSPVLKGGYVKGHHIVANNTVLIEPALFASEAGWAKMDEAFGKTAQPPFFTIFNVMPYAAKVERNELPGGVYYGAWKTTRAKHGSEVAVRFRYYASDKLPIAELQPSGYKQTRPKDGGMLSFPAINIGQPGAFNSGASNVIVKAARKMSL